MTDFQIQKETDKIINFIQKTLKAQGFKKAVIGISGGIDSSVSLVLLAQALGPKNVITIKLPHGQQNIALADKIIKQAKIPTENVLTINIAPIVNTIVSATPAGDSLGGTSHQLRKGNIMVRVRMVLLYDLAKQHRALVCGTENRSEYLLGYFTRYGDEASDFEPIRHLYKTEVRQLAQQLKIPQEVIDQLPSAGLWPGQTDETELGFSYKEADQVLKLYCDQKLDLTAIERRGFKNAAKIISRVKANQFKHLTPYCLND